MRSIEPVQTQAAQFVTHAARTDVAFFPTRGSAQVMAAVAGCEAFELEAKQQEHGEEALHARVAKTQSAGALALNASRALQSFESPRADPAVVAGFLDLEHAAVGRKADLAQLGQVAQKAPYAEVVAIVYGGFGTPGPHRARPSCDTA